MKGEKVELKQKEDGTGVKLRYQYKAKPMDRIRVPFHTDPDPARNLNSDPDPDVPITKFCLLSVLRIRIIFRIRIRSPGCLGSGSLSYYNEHKKINWKEKFNKEYLFSGSCWIF
jgi:hypothetical protein